MNSLPDWGVNDIESGEILAVEENHQDTSGAVR